MDDDVGFVRRYTCVDDDVGLDVEKCANPNAEWHV